MSYCRWSTSDFRCDIYLYEDADGYTMHIAGLRWDYEIPEEWRQGPNVFSPEWPAWYVKREEALRPIKDATQRVPIGLPYDGKTFYFDEAVDVVEKLLELKRLGYRFPDTVIEDLLNE